MKKILFVTVTMVTILLTACEGNQVNELVESEPIAEMKQQAVNNLQGTLCDNVSLDITIITPANFDGTAAVYQAEAKGFQEEAVFQQFDLKKEDCNQLAERLYQYNSSFFEFSDAVGGAFVYSTEAGRTYKAYNPNYTAECSSIANFGLNKELPFMNVKDAEEYALDFISGLGINHTVVLETNALPIAYHQYVEGKEVEAGMLSDAEKLGEKWSELGDCYAIAITTQYENIPLYENSHVAADDSVINGGRMELLVSKDGIQLLNVPTPYVLTGKEADKQKIHTAEEILEEVKTKIENSILTDQYTITKLKLCYFPDIVNKENGELQLTPTWEVVLNGETDGEIIYLFRADTGEEIQ